MKRVTILAAAFFVATAFTSCDSADHENHENNSEMEGHGEHDEHDGHDHGDEESEELSLNDGKKWKVNAEMMVHVRSMEKQITAFSTSTKKDYAALAADLKANIGELTSSCTMTGASHDELHLWLLPHIKMVDELKDAENDKEAAEDFSEIQTSMKTFNQFFE